VSYAPRMRRVVWMGVIGWTGLSCARSQAGDVWGSPMAGNGSGGVTASGGSGSDAGGTQEVGGAAGSLAAGGRGGVAGQGGKSGHGGTAGLAGTAGEGKAGASGNGALGGTGGVAGAQSGTGGTDDGDAGAAGAPDMGCGDYVACGCGCCERSTPESTECFYPELGQDLATIVAADEAAASDPTCAAVECGRGARHVCCDSPEDPGAATYTVTGYIGGYNRLNLKRTGADGRCTRLALVQPQENTDNLELVLPELWGIDYTMDYACEDENSAAADSRRSAIGGLGTLAFTSPSNCTLDVNLTLFFLSESGTVDAVRFAVTGLTVPEGFERGDCS
jgi:hypothetical protein